MYHLIIANGETMKNKVEIELDQNLDELLFRLCHLRKAKNIGDREVINHYQLGQLKWQFVKFHNIG